MLLRRIAISMATFLSSVAIFAQKPIGNIFVNGINKNVSFTDIQQVARMHPRLFLSDDDFESIRSTVRSSSSDSPEIKALHALIMRRAGTIGLDIRPLERRFDMSNRRMLETSRSALERLLLCAYAFRYTGETKYLDHATADLNSVCSFSNWNAENHFLDAAEMALAVGIAYDWLYDALSPQLRSAIINALDSFAFQPSADEDTAWFYWSEGNWNQVCNAGLVTAALATYEACDTTAQRIVNDALWSNREAMQTIYSPSGCYAEGPSYWNYGNMFEAVLLSALESVFGSDFGLSSVEGFAETAEYKSFTYRPFGNTFNYSDNLDEWKPAYPLWYFASRFKDRSLISSELSLLAESEYSESSEVRLLPLLMMWALRLDGEVGEDKEEGHYGIYRNHGVKGQLDDLPLIIHREKDRYLGVKGGSPTTNHAHMDGGSFVYDAFGKGWAIDPDRASYADLEAECEAQGGDFWDMSQGSLRWQMPGIGNLWHSTITINDKQFNVKGKADITETDALDLSSLYEGEVSEVLREISILEDGNLKVEDRITALDDKDAQIRWSFVTPAQVQVGRRCIKLRNGGTMIIIRTTAYIQGSRRRLAVDYKQFPSGSEDFRICGFTAKVPKGKCVVYYSRIGTKNFARK